MGWPKVCTLGPTLTSCFPLRMAEIKKVSRGAEIHRTLGYPNMPKLRLYLPSLLGAKYDYFMHYLDYFWKEAGRGKKSESQNQTLTYPFSPTQSLVNFLWKNFGSNTFQFRCYLSQRTLQKNFTWIFKFACFSWCKAYIFEKKTVRFPDAEFNAESIGTKSQKWKTQNLVFLFLIALFIWRPI